MKYVKKPIPIEAKQITQEQLNELAGSKTVLEADNQLVAIYYHPDCIVIDTDKSTMTGRVGDYFVTGIKGEVYICPQEIFEESYDLYQEEPTA